VDTFVIQPLCRPVNEHFVELTIIIDALKRASAARVTAVIPYFGYARQDRKTSGREPITAKLIANLLVSAGLDRVLTIDFTVIKYRGFLTYRWIISQLFHYLQTILKSRIIPIQSLSVLIWAV
jgi:ribose-phosphate pyrophosphokinase